LQPAEAAFLFIPMGTGIHWYLATVIMKMKQIFITESQDMGYEWLVGVPNNEPKKIEAMEENIKEFLLSKKQGEFTVVVPESSLLVIQFVFSLSNQFKKIANLR
jgi:hypothetical protein